tara:strand:- start:583 stop:1446 length:864 start_codon:yes stop_codon:yes gene_type:complete
MVNLYPQLIKIPAFMTKFIDIHNLGFLKKVFLILKGKLTISVLRLNSKKIICFYFNNFFSFNGKLTYDDNFFIKVVDREKIYYPNNRVTRILINQDEFLEHLFDSYLLKNIEFRNKDLVIDCGSNVGELFLAFKNKSIDINYCGVEPDKNAFYCLNQNTNAKNLNLCLSNSDGKVEFYIDEIGANSSVHESSTTEKKEIIESITLNRAFKNKKIKLLKIDAEGHELEVLQGGSKIINNVEYISVDCGPERGVEQNTTFINVNKFLLNYNFQLIDINKERLIALYKHG